MGSFLDAEEERLSTVLASFDEEFSVAVEDAAKLCAANMLLNLGQTEGTSFQRRAGRACEEAEGTTGPAYGPSRCASWGHHSRRSRPTRAVRMSGFGLGVLAAIIAVIAWKLFWRYCGIGND